MSLYTAGAQGQFGDTIANNFNSQTAQLGLSTGGDRLIETAGNNARVAAGEISSFEAAAAL